MRTRIGIGVGIVIALAGCGGAIDASGESFSPGAVSADAAREVVAPSRPVVGTLRMRDRDVVLTADALEATGNEALREMTAHATGSQRADGPSVTPVMADVDDQYHRASELTSVPASIQAGLDL